jgi:antirestriction protein ArdC
MPHTKGNQLANIYEQMTDRIIAALEEGRIPWKKEWRTSGKTSGLPYNLVSGAPYRGINVFSLLCSGYSQSGWCTYKQAQTLGYQVRKGERSSPVVFWKFPDKARKLEKPDAAPFARFYSVFNIEQLDGVPAELPFEGMTFDPIAECERVVSDFMGSASHPTLGHGGDRAYFSPSSDHVQMPHRETFNNAGGYYATLFHEFAHSTGIKSRCDRAELQAIGGFGDEPYSKEELTAEFASAFLCAETGCSNEERVSNSVAYIQSWIQKLKNDKAMAVQAAQRAQRASDFILLRKFAPAATSEEVAA